MDLSLPRLAVGFFGLASRHLLICLPLLLPLAIPHLLLTDTQPWLGIWMPSSSNGAGSVELECRSCGICELLYRALLIRQLHCCNRSLALILLSLVLLPLRHQNFLLIWFLIRASLLLFVLLPDVLRQGLTSRPLSTVARPISWTLRRSCQVLQSVEKNVSNELGKQASGESSCRRAQFVAEQDSSVGSTSSFLRCAQGNRRIIAYHLPVRRDLLGDHW